MRSEWNEEKLQRYIKEGRGQGEFESYKGFIRVQDFGSVGRSSRLRTWRCNRIVHLLSDIETRFFYLTEFDDSILQVKEHVPLYDFEEVVGEQEDIDIRKFKDKQSGFPYILTTTFLITVRGNDGNTYDVARSVKASHVLERKAVIERFELIRRYFWKKGIDWALLTQKELPIVKAKNIEWIHPARFLEETTDFTKGDISYISGILLESLYKNKRPVREITSSVDSQLNLEAGSGLLLFKHLLTTKQIKIDMNKKIELNQSAEVLEIVPQERQGEIKIAIDR
ncbi:TnsA endonuclease C-terminal domain-containing protein [Niallia sp.]|uniref:TnsA endonuclease C-terminal domain-containing protein n=1 Tax=Niallia sp. TaxID=2837523 RepID=UPI0028A1C5E0|nr:TnsA endonuclease C-terminal domain-containing protein [Niallia sp.]